MYHCYIAVKAIPRNAEQTRLPEDPGRVLPSRLPARRYAVPGHLGNRLDLRFAFNYEQMLPESLRNYQEGDIMKRGMFTLMAVLLLTASAAVAQWSENFDSYALGSGLHGQGGWEGWEGSPAADAFVTDVQAYSAPHSVGILPTSDIVQQFDIASGVWTMSAWNYIPSGSTGKQYFILLAVYDPAGTNQWALDLEFDSDIDMMNVVEGTSSVPIVYDQWTEIVVEINLGSGLQSVYYNGSFVESLPWAAGFLSLQALDLFSDGGSTIFWDDITLVVDNALTPSTWAAIKATIK